MKTGSVLRGIHGTFFFKALTTFLIPPVVVGGGSLLSTSAKARVSTGLPLPSLLLALQP